MTLIRWRPESEIVPRISDLSREMNRLFDSFLRGDVTEEGLANSYWTPAVDILEKDDAYTLEAELPGLKKDDVKISVQDNILTLRGERKDERKESKKGYLRMETNYGSFTRSFTLPTTINASKIEAEFKDGILKIEIPKAEEAKPKMIEVKVK
jgi:HSP20 family protein